MLPHPYVSFISAAYLAAALVIAILIASGRSAADT
jgi:hypothetical protein